MSKESEIFQNNQELDKDLQITIFKRSDLQYIEKESVSKTKEGVAFNTLLKEISVVDNVLGVGIFVYEEGSVIRIFEREIFRNVENDNKVTNSLGKFERTLFDLDDRWLRLNIGYITTGTLSFEDAARYYTVDHPEQEIADSEIKSIYEMVDNNESMKEINKMFALTMKRSTQYGKLRERPKFIKFE